MRAWRKGPPAPIEEHIAATILAAVAVATTLLASPAAGAAVFFLGVGATGYLFRKSDFNREAKRLEKRGYIALTKIEGGWVVKILKKGKARHKKNQVENLRLPSPVKWDGKWRLFVFDIPEKYRSARNQLRQKLKDLGMFNIQRSVFVYPHDCRKELDIIGSHYRIGKYATYAEVSYSDIDRRLRRFFKSSGLI